MNDGFYRAFEERYYAPREVIKELRTQYLPFTHQLANVYPGSPTFDAGCGRGEWLELMIEQGFLPTGVDLDDGMLSACIELQLPAKKGDAIAHMSSLTNESQSVVSAFHVVEHVSFEQLRIFVSEALRVLKPGGLLIMETPNPENIAVSTRNFYLDPTHQRPIPPQLLAFVAEFEGFERVKTLRLQESKDIASRENIGLTEVINCVSPDYAVIAQKKADASLMAKSQELFDAEYGISLDSLTNKLDKRLARIEEQTVQAMKLAQQAEFRAKQAQAQTKIALKKAEQTEAQAEKAEAKAHQAETAVREIGAQLSAVYASKSWRITSPLRWAYGQAKRLKNEGLVSRMKAFAKKAIRKLNHELLKRPSLRAFLVGCASKLGLYTMLNALNQKAHGTNESTHIVSHIERHVAPEVDPLDLVPNQEPTPLSPRAQQIYADLKNAMERQQKESS